jgi:hypothetical protein
MVKSFLHAERTRGIRKLCFFKAITVGICLFWGVLPPWLDAFVVRNTARGREWTPIWQRLLLRKVNFCLTDFCGLSPESHCRGGRSCPFLTTAGNCFTFVENRKPGVADTYYKAIVVSTWPPCNGSLEWSAAIRSPFVKNAGDCRQPLAGAGALRLAELMILCIKQLSVQTVSGRKTEPPATATNMERMCCP